MKKLIVSFLAIVMSVCLLFAFVGCQFDHITVITPDGNIEIDIIPGDGDDDNNDYNDNNDNNDDNDTDDKNDENNDENNDKDIDFSEMTVSDGLKYALNNAGTAYSVIGIGTYTGDNLVIPATHQEEPVAEELPVTAIGDRAFADCYNLTSVTLPASVVEIGSNAFGKSDSVGYGCTNLNGVNYLGDVAGWCGIKFNNAYANPVYYAKHLYMNGKLLTSLTLPNGISEINYYTFFNCAHIQGSLVIPDSVTKIDTMAFYGCSGFTGKLVIPSSVTELGGYAFAYCGGFTSLEMPDRASVKLDMYEFTHCSGLTSVTLGSGLSTISQGMFGKCTNLTTIVIPEGVTKIHQSFFYDCEQLKSVTIPVSVTWMDVDLNDSGGKTNLTDVYYNGSQAQWDKISKENQCGWWTQVTLDGKVQQWGTLKPTLHFAK